MTDRLNLGKGGYNHPTLNELIRRREELILADQTGLTVEQVHTLNNLDPYEIEEQEPRLVVWYHDGNDTPWCVLVRPDGSIDYTAGGAFPELAKHNR